MKTTQHMLDSLATRLNKAAGTPTEIVTGNEWHVGNFHIGSVNGGYTLMRTVNSSGGITYALGVGHIAASRLKVLIQAFIRGIEFANEKHHNKQ